MRITLRSSLRVGISALTLFTGLTTSYAPAYAGELSRDSLIGLAREFVTRVGNGFDQAADTPREQNLQNRKTTDRIPDGEELILQTFAGQDRIPLNYDILAIKQSYGADLLLEDFFNAVGFPIFLDYDANIADGWFLREDNSFTLDINNQTVTINGETTDLSDGDVFDVDGEIYAKSTAVAEWFDLDFSYDFEELQLAIQSPVPLPAEERFIRENRNPLSTNSKQDPVLPFEELEYRAVGIPSLDVNLRANYNKQGDNDPRKQTAYSVIGAGDFAYLNTKAFISGDSDEPVTTARLTFQREDLDGGLLGPLNAKFFSFGDVQTTRLPISALSTQEQGVRVTNNINRERSGFSTTFFRGDAQPGWDAELYRDDTLIANQRIDEDGLYEFLDVPLFIGENRFRIVLYGPQGEIREINENVPITQSALTGMGPVYDVSLTRNNEITYSANRLGRDQDGTPVLRARMDVPLGDTISGYTGFQSRDEGDKRRNYVEAGANAYLFNTFFDLNTSLELSEQEFGAELVTRRNFGEHALRTSTFLATSDFQPGATNENNPTRWRSDLQLNGPAPDVIGTNSNYNLTTQFILNSNGDEDLSAAGAYSTRLKNTILNQSLGYNSTRRRLLNTNDESLRYNLNTRGFYKGGFYRIGGSVDILPDTALEALFASYSYPFTPNLSSQVEVEHRIEPSQTDFTGALNWKTEKATVSPRINFDTDSNVQASVNVRFGVGYNPTTNDFNLYNQRLTTTGAVAARIYLDENGNGILDEGEELIKGAELNAPQVRRKAASDERGIAYIPDLPRGIITDITLDQTSLYDPYYIPNFEGVSIRPRPGVVKEIDFPVVVGGEMDGSVYYTENDILTPARQYNVQLVAPWGEVVAATRTAYDGFYVFSNVQPGVYFLTGDYKSAVRTGSQTPTPQLYTFKPDGSVFYEQNLEMSPGKAIAYKFKSDIEATSRKNRKVLQKIGDITARPHIGPFKSKLALGFAMLKFKRMKNTLSVGAALSQSLDDIERSKEDKLFRAEITSAETSIKGAEDICQALNGFDIACEVHIYTSTYNDETLSYKAENADEKKG